MREPDAAVVYGGQVVGELAKDAGITPDGILTMLRAMRGIVRGLPVDQLTHALQTAARAERAGADADVVAGALCHDVAKVLSSANHPAIAAELIRPFVREEVYLMVKHHQVALHGHVDELERAGEAAVALARRFADEWDRYAFDPSFDTPPLEHFEPVVREVFGRPAKLPPRPRG